MNRLHLISRQLLFTTAFAALSTTASAQTSPEPYTVVGVGDTVVERLDVGVYRATSAAAQIAWGVALGDVAVAPFLALQVDRGAFEKLVVTAQARSGGDRPTETFTLGYTKATFSKFGGRLLTQRDLSDEQTYLLDADASFAGALSYTLHRDGTVVAVVVAAPGRAPFTLARVMDGTQARSGGGHSKWIELDSWSLGSGNVARFSDGTTIELDRLTVRVEAPLAPHELGHLRGLHHVGMSSAGVSLMRFSLD